MITIDNVIRQIQFNKVLARLYRKDVIDYHPYNTFKWSIQKNNYQTDNNFIEYSCINRLQLNIFAYESRLLKEKGMMLL